MEKEGGVGLRKVWGKMNMIKAYGTKLPKN